jgi:hypothetical protein
MPPPTRCFQTGTVTINERRGIITVSRSFVYEGSTETFFYRDMTDSEDNATNSHRQGPQEQDQVGSRRPEGNDQASRRGYARNLRPGPRWQDDGQCRQTGHQPSLSSSGAIRATAPPARRRTPESGETHAVRSPGFSTLARTARRGRIVVGVTLFLGNLLGRPAAQLLLKSIRSRGRQNLRSRSSLSFCHPRSQGRLGTTSSALSMDALRARSMRI